MQPYILLQFLFNGISIGFIYALAALGYTMIHGTLKFINFQHGALAMIGAYLAYQLWLVNFPFFLSCVFSIFLVALIGIVIEKVAYRPLRGVSVIAPLVTSLGISMFLEAAAFLTWGTDVKSYGVPLGAPLNILGAIITPEQILIIAMAIGIMVTLRFIILKTRLGRAIRATSENLEMAITVGVDIDRIISIVFAIGSGLAAVAGIAIALDSNLHPTMGMTIGLKAFSAAILGGIGSFKGAVLGGLVIGIAETISVIVLTPVWKDAVSFVILILVLLFRPQGILGEKIERVKKI